MDSAGLSGRASYSDSISKSSGFETYRANSTSNDCSPDPDKKSFDRYVLQKSVADLISI